MKIRIPLIPVLLLALGFTACKHDDTPAPNYITAVNVINASQQTVNFFLNGTRLNKNGNLFPGSNSGYFNVNTPGAQVAQNYQFKAPNTTAVILNLPLKLDTNSGALVFIAGLDGKQGFAIQRDSVPQPDSLNTAFVRFINASPENGSLKLAVGDTVKFNSVAYQGKSIYSRVGPGAKSVKVYSADGTLLKTITSPILLANTSYTFFAMDSVKSASATVITLRSMVNQ